jgi:thiamine-phosphate pyrophosphorylase
MQVIVISPEAADPREVPAMEGLFGAGLETYHVRKPAWSPGDLESWIGALPRAWRPRIRVHGQRRIAERLGLGGWHDRDLGERPSEPGASRSCHDLPALRGNLAAYETLLFGPVFPSITKAGYGPAPGFPWDELRSVLRDGRRPSDARVLAVGGVTAAGLSRCRKLGFDGGAVLGAVWGAPDPVAAFIEIRLAAARLEAARHAA